MSSVTNYRKEFVQFLFSLCVAQIAVFAAAVTTIDPLWSWNKLAVVTHLTLAIVVVWTSWFGWRSSVEKQKLDEQNPFGRSAWLALLDVGLVICYFLLIRSADMVDVEQGKRLGSSAALESPTPHPESRTILLMFVIFLVWDIVSKWEWWPARASGVKWKCPWPSICCVCISGLVVLLTATVHKTGNFISAGLFDSALVLVVFMFRQMKQIQLLRIESKASRDPSAGAGLRVWTAWLLGTFVLMCLMCWLGLKSIDYWPKCRIVPLLPAFLSNPN